MQSSAHDPAEPSQSPGLAPSVADTPPPHELTRSTDPYHALFHAMEQGFCVVEVFFDDTSRQAIDFRYRELNSAFLQQSGLPADTLGRSIRELLPDLDPFWFATYGEVARSGKPRRFEHHVPQVSRWFDVHSFRVGAPEAHQVAVLFNDVTAQKHNEAALRASEERQAFMLRLSDALRPLTCLVDIQATTARALGQHLGVDRAYYVDIDEAAQEFVVAGDWHHPDAPGHARRYPLATWAMPWLLTGETWVCYDVDTDPDLPAAQRAEYRAHDIRAAIVVPLLKHGRLVATLAANQDAPRAWTPPEVALLEETLERTWTAVERARAEEARAASEAQYRTLFASIDEGFCTIEVLFDAQGQATDYRFLEANPAFVRQTGLENAVGRTMRELAPAHENFWFDTYGRIARTGEAQRFEHGAAALGFFYDVYAFRIGAPAENRVAILFNDIAARKQAEAALQQLADELRQSRDRAEGLNVELQGSNEQLTRTNVDLDNFIYTASHDLRVPIVNIEGLLLALARELPPAARTGDVSQLLQFMQDSVNRFQRTIAHLTDVSKLQQAHDQPLTRVHLAAVVEEVRLDLLPLVEQTQATLMLDVPAEAHVPFSEKNLRSVVYNLLSNALKYRHPDRAPHVQLTYGQQEQYHVLRVQDNGLGLDLAHGTDKLFGLFQRLHTHVDGSGIGLYMVKKMVENASGRIDVASRPDEGTAFTIFFPVHPAS